MPEIKFILTVQVKGSAEPADCTGTVNVHMVAPKKIAWKWKWVKE